MKMRALQAFETSGTTNAATRSNIPEDLSLYFWNYDDSAPEISALEDIISLAFFQFHSCLEKRSRSEFLLLYYKERKR
jgi:hypothetical protein